MNICLRIMELLNGRAARYGSARVVELVAAWVGGLCSQGCAVWQAPKRCTVVASSPDKESPLGLSNLQAVLPEQQHPPTVQPLVCCRPT